MVSKVNEVRTKTDEQLKDEVVALKKEGLNLRFQQASGELKNTNRRRVVKREVARIKTVLTERAMGKKIEPKAEVKTSKAKEKK